LGVACKNCASRACFMRHLCHIMVMKTVSIRQLHERTGRYVREAREHAVVVTDHGRRVAVIKSFSEAELPGVPFPVRSAAELPSVSVDSTDVVSEDRDGG